MRDGRKKKRTTAPVGKKEIEKMEKVQITKEDFFNRFNAAKKRKQDLVESLQQELMNEHKASTGCTATNIFVM